MLADLRLSVIPAAICEPRLQSASALKGQPANRSWFAVAQRTIRLLLYTYCAMAGLSSVAAAGGCMPQADRSSLSSIGACAVCHQAISDHDTAAVIAVSSQLGGTAFLFEPQCATAASL